MPDAAADDHASIPDMLTGPDLPAAGNDVAIESIEIAHEGLELEDAAQGTGVSVKYTMFLSDGTPVRNDEDENDQSTLARLMPENNEAGSGKVVLHVRDVSQDPATSNDSDDDPDLGDPD